MRSLVLTDVRHQPGGGALAGDEVGVGEHCLRPGEGVEGGDLDQQDVDHPLDQHLEVEIEVGEDARLLHLAADPLRVGRRAAPADAHPVEHPGRLVLGDRVLERDVARREPHLLVTGLGFETRLVARVRLEQAPM